MTHFITKIPKLALQIVLTLKFLWKIKSLENKKMIRGCSFHLIINTNLFMIKIQVILIHSKLLSEELNCWKCLLKSLCDILSAGGPNSTSFDCYILFIEHICPFKDITIFQQNQQASNNKQNHIYCISFFLLFQFCILHFKDKQGNFQ